MKSTSRSRRRRNACPSSNFAAAVLPLPATILEPPLEIPMLAQRLLRMTRYKRQNSDAYPQSHDENFELDPGLTGLQRGAALT